MTYDPTYIPGWAQIAKTGEYSLFYKGVIYTAHLLKPEVEPQLKYFVGFPGKKYLVVSNNIPPEFLKHILAQEIREFVDFPGEHGRCLKCVKLELEKVSADIKQNYIVFLRNFFKDMIEYYNGQTSEYINGLKTEIAEAFEYLDHLVMSELELRHHP